MHGRQGRIPGNNFPVNVGCMQSAIVYMVIGGAAEGIVRLGDPCRHPVRGQ